MSIAMFANYLAEHADLVQTLQGSIWLVKPSGELLKLDFWPDSSGQLAQLDQMAPCITAWRESGRNGGQFGRWHNVAEEVAA